MSEEQQALSVEEALAVVDKPTEAQPELTPEQKALEEENYMLIQFQGHLDRALKLLYLASANGARRVVTAYLKAGVYEIPKLQDKVEKELFNRLMALHDIKYALINKAIEASAKQAETETEEKKETVNEQQ